MTDFDLVIRNGTIATAADVFAAEIGIRDERIVALGTGLGAGREEIDATGRSYCPAASMRIVTSTSPDGRVGLADDFHSGTRSAACGGTTTVIPFAAQRRASRCAPRSRTIIAAPTARRSSTMPST